MTELSTIQRTHRETPSNGRHNKTRQLSNSRQDDDRRVRDLHKSAEGADHIISQTGDFISNSLNTGVTTLVKTCSKVGSTFNLLLGDENGSKSQKALLLPVTLFFGLISVKGGIDLLGNLFSSEFRQKHAPTLFTGLKTLLASILATGAFRHFTNKSGFLPMKALTAGSLGFLFIHSLIKVYEDKNSIFNRLAKLLGVDHLIQDLMRSLSLTHFNKASTLAALD